MAEDSYRYFRSEARELLDQLGKGVLDLEKPGAAAELLPRMLRAAHTLKGAAGVVRQTEIAGHAHAIEDALAPIRDSGEPLAAVQVDALLTILDAITRRLGMLPASQPEPSPRAEFLGEIPPEETSGAMRADVAVLDELLDGLAEAHVQLDTLGGTIESVERAATLADQISGHLAAAQLRGGAGETGVSKARAAARELRGLLGTLDRDLGHKTEQLGRELGQTREAAERLSLLPADSLFTALERTARDVAQQQGKEIRFEGQGGRVRIDANILSAVQGALVQAVRNAVAHGIESPEERSRAGKLPQGRVSVNVKHSAGQLVFTCRDDGAGVDLEEVRRVAQQRGIIAPDALELGPEELIGLLLTGGLTTAGDVTTESGRGVGLDIVREVAQRLGGEVTIRTEAGKGTSVWLAVPASLTSMVTLTVEASGVTVSLPLDSVLSCVRILPEEVVRAGSRETVSYAAPAREGGTDTLRESRAGDLVPFLPLSRAISSTGAARGAAHRAVPGAGPQSKRAWTTVFIAAGGGVAAFGADRLVGIATVVVRALPELAAADPIVAGITLDAAGNPQMVLDAAALVAFASETSGPSETSEAPEMEPALLRPQILVIDDSLTTRMLERAILEAAGYDVDLATSGEEALEKARNGHFGLFLVDVEMPGIDGFTFVERARADPSIADAPSILVTSRESPQDRKRGLDAGAKAYIVKNEFHQGALLAQIRTLVG